MFEIGIIQLLLCVLGVGVGIVFGALPGMTATMAIAVFLPLTYAYDMSSTASAICCALVTTCPSDCAVALAIFCPLSMDRRDSSIRDVVFLAASPLLFARFRTSSATTAKPFPASPARAASTAAFKASIFVWNAMSAAYLL